MFSIIYSSKIDSNRLLSTKQEAPTSEGLQVPIHQLTPKIYYSYEYKIDLYRHVYINMRYIII